jgi:hypothetical protein
MKRAIPIDVYDQDGNMTKIEVQDASGNHIADFVWDPTDEQTSENRIKFRQWCYDFLEKNKQFKVSR